MRTHHSLTKDRDANTAATEAAKGAVWGATKVCFCFPPSSPLIDICQWGVPFLALGVIGYQMSPIYRGLTIQFKTFIQLSGMTLGGYLEADSRVRMFQQRIRLQQRAERDQEVWRQWEGLVDRPGGGGGGAGGKKE